MRNEHKIISENFGGKWMKSLFDFNFIIYIYDKNFKQELSWE